jgi:hypothetical protein
VFAAGAFGQAEAQTRCHQVTDRTARPEGKRQLELIWGLVGNHLLNSQFLRGIQAAVAASFPSALG